MVRNYDAPADTFSTGDGQTRPPFVVEFEYMEGTNSAASHALRLLISQYLLCRKIDILCNLYILLR